MIKRAVALSPGSEEFLFVLAQLHMRKENFAEALKVLTPLAATGADPSIRASAQAFLASISAIKEQMARFRTGREERATEPLNRPVLNADATGQTTTTEKLDPSSYLRDALRKPADGETQVEGILLRIECVARAITFVVRVGDRLLRLKTDSFENIDITTFSSDVAGEISCGPRKPENAVVICYLPLSGARAKIDGLIRSIEFVPKDFKLKS